MKPIELMTSEEKAVLIHQLFPAEISPLVYFIKEMAATIKEDEESNRRAWKNENFDFNMWLELITEIEKRIMRYRTELNKDSALFGNQLFKDMHALYTEYCILLYINMKRTKNERFLKALDLFFSR